MPGGAKVGEHPLLQPALIDEAELAPARERRRGVVEQRGRQRRNAAAAAAELEGEGGEGGTRCAVVHRAGARRAECETQPGCHVHERAEEKDSGGAHVQLRREAEAPSAVLQQG